MSDWNENVKFQLPWRKGCVNLLNKWVNFIFIRKFCRKGTVFRKNLHSWKKFYTTAGCDGRGKYQVWEDLLLFGPSFDICAVLGDFVSPHLFTFEHQARPGLPTQQGPAWWLEGGFHQSAWLSVHALASKWEGLWNSIQMGLNNWNTPKI